VQLSTESSVLCLVLICGGLTGAPPDAPGRDDLEAYRSAAARVGRDPDAHVRLALWCEARGLEPERLKHLALAVLNAPDHAAARGLMGLVQEGGRWATPEVVARRLQGDPARAAALDEYHKRREAIADTAEAHWQLAQWCEQAGLATEAQVHLAAVVRLNSSREDAWKKLGYRRQDGRWVSTKELKAARTDAEARRRADSHWRPLLAKWKAWLGSDSRRAEAEAALAGVDDPRAVPAIWRVFALGGPADQERAVSLLRRLDGMAASRALAALAVTADTADTRRLAAEGLAGRDPREFAGLLIGLLRTPVKYEVRQVGGPGMPGELYVRGENGNSRRFYSAPPPLINIRPGDLVAFDNNGQLVLSRVVAYGQQPISAVVNPLLAGAADLTGAADALTHAGFGEAGQVLGEQLVEHQKQAVAAGATVARGGRIPKPLVAQLPLGQLMTLTQQQIELSRQRLQADIAALDRYNDDVNRLNDRARPALRIGLGEDLGADRQAWLRWWKDLSETTAASPTLAPAPDRGAPRPTTQGPAEAHPPGIQRRAWIPGLARGTPVWSLAGIRPIEELRAGDKVLTQDVATGALEFAPVLTIRRHASEPVKTVALGDAALVATDLERLWVAGKGWVTAGELKRGDTLRALGGVVQVAAVDVSKARSVFHVQVALGRGIFVGRRGILAHDDQPAQPIATPFDAAPARVLSGR
jgi:hypothetical protein